MKFVQEHCSICNQELAMPVVQEDQGHPGIFWVQCPSCREIKPIEIEASLIAEGEADSGYPPEAESNSRGSQTRRVVRHYRAGERFLPGEWIYHPEWKDTGRVVDKCRSKGGHDIIVVSFEKMGTKRLISNFIG